MHSKKLFFVLVVIIIVLVVAAAVLGAFLKKVIPGAASEYAAVYLATGDLYYGKISWFPVPHLKDVWYLQRGVSGQNQSQLAITPFDTVFWEPVNKLYLNPKQVVWWTYVRNNSPLLEGFETSRAQRALPQTGTGIPNQQQQQQQQGQEFQGPTEPPPGQEVGN